ncbi:MAG: carboxypeptidase regulatory-like domain-containing protein, partial [Nitrospira sp.]|nr:carboxypeptidase regulatory-like domain-containing protein [Nitrospira sp.]
MVMRVMMIVMFLLMSPSMGLAYEESPITNGGAIRGQIRVNGDPPRPMAFNLVTIPDAVYCGRISTGTGWRIVEDFIIGPQGSLKDAVVMVKGVEKGKPFSLPKVEIEAIDCDFLPFVNVVRDQDEITVINMDPVEHDIQGYETARERG